MTVGFQVFVVVDGALIALVEDQEIRAYYVDEFYGILVAVELRVLPYRVFVEYELRRGGFDGPCPRRYGVVLGVGVGFVDEEQVELLGLEAEALYVICERFRPLSRSDAEGVLR